MNGQILFVDDDEDDVFLIERACKAVGIEQPIRFLANGQEAVNCLSEVSDGSLPALIFLDLNMPLMAGLEMLDWLRQQPALKTIPVVVLTTSENPQDVKSAFSSGANAYLVKPSSFEALGKMLKCATDFWLAYNRSR